MLHDPAYRERYEVDLRREFPRVYFQDDFRLVVAARDRSCWTCTSGSRQPSRTRWSETTKHGVQLKTKAVLRADKEAWRHPPWTIRSTLTGVPPKAWEYQSG